MNYQTAREIEIAVTHYFGITTHVIVPNVSYGMFGYELDMVVLNSNSFYAYEVEIKISRSDLKKDGEKRHQHENNGIRLLYFAMPEKMEKCSDLVPARAGILLVDAEGRVRLIRRPTAYANARKWTVQEAYKLGRLGCMRISDLRDRLNRSEREIRALRSGNDQKCTWIRESGSYGGEYYRLDCSDERIFVKDEQKRIYKLCPLCGRKVQMKGVKK